jgi:hypothetical protein
MSYSLQLAVKIATDDGVDYFARIDEPKYNSPTYNLSLMFRMCMNWDYEQEKYYKCSEVIDRIERGIRELHLNFKEYEKYNPENGWGNVNNATEALESLRDCIYKNAKYIPVEYLYMKW